MSEFNVDLPPRFEYLGATPEEKEVELEDYLGTLDTAIEDALLRLHNTLDISVIGATEDNLPKFDADGLLVDSGVAYDNLALLTGNQTIAGIKTFSSFPITPSSAPTTDYQAANKKYVDDEVTTASALFATLALDNLATVAINVSLISDTDNTDDLGSAAKEWKDLYIDGVANIDSLIADTADINAGTMDGVQVDAATLTGMLYTNNASDALAQLGSQGTSGQVLTSAGAGANPTFETPSTGGNSEMITSSGTFTAPAGVTCVMVTLCGGGAGAGGCTDANDSGGGGGAGAWIERVGIEVTPAGGYTVTVGAAGAGGVGQNDGVDGGNTSFAGLNLTVTVNGGDKGIGGSSGAGGPGGAATGASAKDAAAGTGGYITLSTAGGAGQTGGGGGGDGAGGGTKYGQGGDSVLNTDGEDGKGFGAGGSAGHVPAGGGSVDGGAGFTGFVLVEW